MKRFIATGCLWSLLFLAACGAGVPEGDQTPVTEQPAETAAPVIVEPSAPPESTVMPAEENLPVQDVPQTPEETDTDDGTPDVLNQERQSAAGSFTGVMGTEFVVPEGFIQLEESPSIGYQYTFWHPDYEIRIVVYEIAPGSIPEGAYEIDYNIAKNNPDVTYFNKGENWFVQSGYNNDGEEIFYSKESATDRGLKTFWITYPTAKREFGDSISADFEKNCRF